MNKKITKNTKKLVLSTATIRQLVHPELVQVVGGDDQSKTGTEVNPCKPQ